MILKEIVQLSINLIKTPDNENSFFNKAKEMVKNGIEVSIVGKRVVEALNDGEFYIFTHPNYRPLSSLSKGILSLDGITASASCKSKD